MCKLPGALTRLGRTPGEFRAGDHASGGRMMSTLERQTTPVVPPSRRRFGPRFPRGLAPQCGRARRLPRGRALADRASPRHPLPPRAGDGGRGRDGGGLRGRAGDRRRLAGANRRAAGPAGRRRRQARRPLRPRREPAQQEHGRRAARAASDRHGLVARGVARRPRVRGRLAGARGRARALGPAVRRARRRQVDRPPHRPAHERQRALPGARRPGRGRGAAAQARVRAADQRHGGRLHPARRRQAPAHAARPGARRAAAAGQPERRRRRALGAPHRPRAHRRQHDPGGRPPARQDPADQVGGGEGLAPAAAARGRGLVGGARRRGGHAPARRARLRPHAVVAFPQARARPLRLARRARAACPAARWRSGWRCGSAHAARCCSASAGWAATGAPSTFSSSARCTTARRPRSPACSS